VQNVGSIEEKLLNLDAGQLGIYLRDVSYSLYFTFLSQLQAYQLRKGSGCARGDDASSLKPAVVSWLGSLFDPKHTHAPLSPTNKSERGFEHHITGKLLCPIDYDWNDTE
jgi:hypothetical protein